MEPKKWPWYAKVEAERGLRGWSRSHIAREIGVKQKPLDEWLKGEATPRNSHEVIKKLAELFGWPVLWLADEDEAYPLQLDSARIEAAMMGVGPEGLEIVMAIVRDPDLLRFLHSQMALFHSMRAGHGQAPTSTRQ